MPSIRERIEIARRLRHLARNNPGMLSRARGARVAITAQEIIGIRDAESMADALSRLADLIDPEDSQ